jgi:hypothetical protein
MTDLRQAAQQALDALHAATGCCLPDGEDDVCNAAITAIEQALAQPEQEPTQWRDMVVVNLVREGINKHKARELADHFATPPAAQWDKPSASFNEWWDSDVTPPTNPFADGSAAYWAWAGWQAAQRKWQGLTDEDFLEACQIAERGNYLLALQRIQIKLKERNT